jgi:putative restriction endonuclease
MATAPSCYVAVTDREWYRFLAGRPELDEVNFWQPGGSRLFRALEPGEPFLFKLHHPDHFIVGGGFFVRSVLLPLYFAWDAFGEKNGAPSLESMRTRIERYRASPADPRGAYSIGCILLSDAFFWPRADWIPVPDDFRPNVVQGKTYDLRSEQGQRLWDGVRMRLHAPEPGRIGEPERPTFGDPVLVRPRLGQGTFRVLVTETYRRRCAVTQEKVLPVLEAAHIRPITVGGAHRIDNGLLLRADVHALFDRGYVSVTPDYRVQVSSHLKRDFDNGEVYYQLHGKDMWLPSEPDYRPRQELLEWHADTVFLR